MYVPTATYRLQFGPSFGFKDAKSLISYLHDLGISDIYASPVFKANKGSTHGYDVTNPNELNPELGSPEDFSALTAKRNKYDIGWIQDIVPNHMSYSSGNQMLMDVFSNGRNSPYYDFFDVEWDHHDKSIKGKILAPFLGKSYPEALHDGEIQLELSDSRLVVRYYNISFPLALSSYAPGKCQKNMPAPEPLLEKQLFKLCFWKKAARVINYRRFFYLNDFISLKVENAEVFRETHKLIASLVRRDVFTGLRIDHVDGLYNPVQYLTRLRQLAGDKYIVVEKILELDEALPENWPVQGTTGYDFCNYVNGIFVRREYEQVFTEVYHNFLNKPVYYEELLIEKKRAICEKYMAGEIDNLVQSLSIAAKNHRHELNRKNIRQAIIDIICAFTVYRTYISDESYGVDEKTCMTEAINGAKRNNPTLKDSINLVGQFLLLDLSDADVHSDTRKIVDFVMKFQQLTGPVMAKGLEDTLLYDYNRLVGLNEVGSSPNCFGISMDEFHKFNIDRAEHWPHCLNATTTHDTKRGEDVRARIAVLTEIPELWSDKVRHWKQINTRFKSKCHGIISPDPNDEYLLYQTMIGAMPFEPKEYKSFNERIKQYIVKVVREAKRHSSWIEPNQQYEQAFCLFVDRIMDSSASNEFWRDFLVFQKQIAAYGILYSLSQTMLKMTSPGVPDFYQGSELWDLSLVDPDNRRPVDFEKRIIILNEIRSGEIDSNTNLIDELLQTRTDGRIKLFLIYKILNERRKRPGLFEKGDYHSLKACGKYSNHVVAYIRSRDDQSIATIAPRFLRSLIGAEELPLGPDVWQDTEIALPVEMEGNWQNAITGETVRIKKTVQVCQILARFPVSLLIRT
jgi:(1->4)-alpha-D-glucan 1-alpha-D-glucosylmutase